MVARLGSEFVGCDGFLDLWSTCGLGDLCLRSPRDHCYCYRHYSSTEFHRQSIKQHLQWSAKKHFEASTSRFVAAFFMLRMLRRWPWCLPLAPWEQTEAASWQAKGCRLGRLGFSTWLPFCCSFGVVLFLFCFLWLNLSLQSKCSCVCLQFCFKKERMNERTESKKERNEERKKDIQTSVFCVHLRKPVVQTLVHNQSGNKTYSLFSNYTVIEVSYFVVSGHL